MKLVLGLIAFASLLNVQSANACAGFGLQKDDLVALMTDAETNLNGSKELAGMTVKSIVWSDIKPGAGAVGDCGAKELAASVSIMTTDAKGEYCDFEGSVRIFKSERLGNTYSYTLNKGVFCRE